MRNFRNSPLWLIGFFILFAEATAGLAAVNIDGWPQASLVIFVIAYSTVVTAIFFAFLWFKPENFYGPTEYADISPESYVKALKGLPAEAAQAVSRYESNPSDNEALFSLMANLLNEEAKQHIILMEKNDSCLDISQRDENGFTHSYELVTENSVNFGSFSPERFASNVDGAELVEMNSTRTSLSLTDRGKSFATWMKKNNKQARMFNSDKGSWGEKIDITKVLREINENDSE